VFLLPAAEQAFTAQPPMASAQGAYVDLISLSRLEVVLGFAAWNRMMVAKSTLLTIIQLAKHRLHV
jgi:hypothetical protein